MAGAVAIALVLAACDGERTNESPVGSDPVERWSELSIEVDGGGKTLSIRVELAVTREETRAGLMYRNSMPWKEGMLFLYRTEKDRRGLTMWRSEDESVRFPLSAAFLDEDGRIVHLVDMDVGPDPVEGYVCSEPSRYVLEMNLGFFEREGIEIGDRVEIPEGVQGIAGRWGR